MKKVIGLWLDREEAVIALVTNTGVDIRRIRSQPAGAAGASDTGQTSAAQGPLGRQSTSQLNQYYDTVIGNIREAGFILIFGMGDVPAELSLRMEAADLGGRIMLTETAGKMTDSQIAGRARRHLEKLKA